MHRLDAGAQCAVGLFVSTLALAGCAAAPPRDAVGQPPAHVASSAAATATPSREHRPAVAAPYFPTTSAAEAGIDPEALATLRRRGEETHSDALIVIRDGKLVLDERYAHPDSTIETMSVSKSLVALVVGRLVDLGKLQSIDEPVHHFYPEWKQGKKERITIRHLLEQTSGLQANRTTEEIYASPDFVRLALAAEVTTDPGTTFFYNNKAVNLLAGVVRVASGERLDVFARRELFGRMGIDDVGWELDRAGNPHAMSGIQLRPLDLAKVGQMMLDLGRFDGKTIVGEDWIRAMTAPSAKQNTYGRLVWIEHDSSFVLDDSVFDAWKKGGMEPAFAAKLRPLKDKVFRPGDDYLGTIAATLGGEKKSTLESWYDHTWRRGLPDAHAVDMRLVGYRMDGYLGQFLVVLPEKRLVAVRMRRFRENEGDAREYGFQDFGKRVRALVAAK